MATGENHGFTVKRLTNNATVVVTVTASREYRARVWLGLRLIRLGVWITGMGFEYKGFKEVPPAP